MMTVGLPQREMEVEPENNFLLLHIISYWCLYGSIMLSCSSCWSSCSCYQLSATPAPATPAPDTYDPANPVCPPAPSRCYNLCLNKQISHMSYMGIVFKSDSKICNCFKFPINSFGHFSLNRPHCGYFCDCKKKVDPPKKKKNLSTPPPPTKKKTFF